MSPPFSRFRYLGQVRAVRWRSDLKSSVPLAQQVGIVFFHKSAKFPRHVIDGVGIRDPQDLLLDRVDHPLNHAASAYV